MRALDASRCGAAGSAEVPDYMPAMATMAFQYCMPPTRFDLEQLAEMPIHDVILDFCWHALPAKSIPKINNIFNSGHEGDRRLWRKVVLPGITKLRRAEFFIRCLRWPPGDAEDRGLG